MFLPGMLKSRFTCHPGEVDTGSGHFPGLPTFAMREQGIPRNASLSASYPAEAIRCNPHPAHAGINSLIGFGG